MRELLLKMAGGEQSRPAPRRGNLLRVVGSCLAIACIALLERYATGNSGFPLLIGSFGASAVLASEPYAARWHSRATWWAGISCPRSWASRVTFLFPGSALAGSCLAVATAIALMHVTKPCTLREAPRRSSRSRAGGHPPARLSVRLRAVPARGADHARHRPYREQHPQGAALSAILVVVGRPSGSRETARKGREARKRQRREGGVPL